MFSRLADPFPGQETPLSTARAALPFDIQMPQVLPPNLSLTHVRLVKEVKLVYLIFTTSKLAEPFSAEDVLSSGGIIMMQSWDAADPTEFISSRVEQSNGLWKDVNINGGLGVASFGKIHWWKNNVHYEILALQGIEQLTAIANSVGR